ncbi:MAG: histidine kinase dimerization/phosphoacceptor domain -containing protein [Bacteroidota bacterium]
MVNNYLTHPVQRWDILLVMITIFIVSYRTSPLWAQAAVLPDVPLDSLISWYQERLDKVYETNQFDETYAEGYAILQRARTAQDLEQVARSHINLATWHFYVTEKIDSFYYHDSLALWYARQTDDAVLAAKMSTYVSGDLVQLGRFREGERLLFDALAVYEARDMRAEVSDIYDDLCYLHKNNDNFAASIEYGERALSIQRQLEDPYQQESTLLYLGQSYAEAGQFDSAQVKVALALGLADAREGSTSFKAKLIGTRGMIYERMGQYDLALQDYRESWELVKSISTEESEADGYKGDIGNILRLQGEYEAAIPYLEDFIALFEQLGRSTEGFMPDYYLQLAECYQKTNRSAAAATTYRKAYDLKATLLKAENEALKEELEIKYETQQKEATIAEQATSLAQQRRTQRLGVALILLLVTGLLIAWAVYRSVQRRRRVLAQLNAALESKNQQNELLLKEIHHRVKNNLQILSSLLYLQSRHIEDDTALAAIKAGQNRVDSIGLIHQKLYLGDHLASVEIQDYLRTLGQNLLDAFDIDEDRIRIDYEVQPLHLDVDTAIPLGLIVNELLNNTLKYAFPASATGRIVVQLEEVENTLRLLIQDDGIGVPSTATAAQGTGFGTRLIGLLTKKMQGEVEILPLDQGYGTRIILQKYQLVTV